MRQVLGLVLLSNVPIEFVFYIFAISLSFVKILPFGVMVSSNCEVKPSVGKIREVLTLAPGKIVPDITDTS